MNNPKISIIANFYNCTKFIPKLLKSVFRQSYSNWELVCVDDCSPSNDASIIEKISNKNGYSKQVKIIRNKKNLGLSNTRQVGINSATGEYLTFLDGDDWLEIDALQKMIDAALQFDVDLVFINYYQRFPLGIYKKQFYSCKYNIPIYKDDIINDYYISFFGINKISVTCWGKLIRTELVKQSKFQYGNIFMGEDLLFNIYLFPLLNSMVCIDYYGYNYRFGGFTSSNRTIAETKKIILEFIELYRIKSKLAEEVNYEKAYRPMKVELKNVLFSNFSFISKYKPHDARSIEAKNVIAEILKIKDYLENICSLLQYERYANDSFIKAISNNDIETIYKICHANYRKDWKKRFLKRILHFIK